MREKSEKKTFVTPNRLMKINLVLFEGVSLTQLRCYKKVIVVFVLFDR